MRETVTDAIVLDVQKSGDSDRVVDLFTEDLGRIKVKVKSGSKISSKLSPHLDILNWVSVRVVHKNQYRLADVLTKERFNNIRDDMKKLGRALDILALVKNLTPEDLPDKELWFELLNSFSAGELDYKSFLRILGYDPSLSSCFFCGEEVKFFLVKEQMFLCNQHSKENPNKDDLIIPIYGKKEK